MTDLEKLERKLSRIENKIDNLKEELDSMPERWINKRAEKEDEISDLRSDKRALKREIKALEEELSASLINKKKSNPSKQADEGCNNSKKSYSENRNISNYSSRMEGDWSIRVYNTGFATAKKGRDFLKANSEDQLLDKIREFEERQEEESIRAENEELNSEIREVGKQIAKNSVIISKLKSKILNSNLQDKSILDEAPVASKQISFTVIYPNNVRETNEKYKEMLECSNETLHNQEIFIDKLQAVADQIEDDDEQEKFYSSCYKDGKSRTAEEKRANYDYRCDKCHGTIVKGSQYICLTIHGTTSKAIPKKLYGGRQYYRTIHSNAAYRYHIGCYE